MTVREARNVTGEIPAAQFQVVSAPFTGRGQRTQPELVMRGGMLFQGLPDKFQGRGGGRPLEGQHPAPLAEPGRDRQEKEPPPFARPAKPPSEMVMMKASTKRAKSITLDTAK
jgi:hypothetical protein